MWHAYKFIRYVIWDVYRVIKNVTWVLCTWLSEMWHEMCAQGYQKCDIFVHRFIRNVTFVQGYQKCDIRHAQCYQKCDMRHVYRVIRNVTRCTRGYQKCDMRCVHRVMRNVTWDMYRVIRNVIWDAHRVIRNVTWYMCTGLSEILNHNEQSTLLSVAVMYTYTKLQTR